MKLKKILAGAMAGAMVLGSLSVVSAETISEKQIVDSTTLAADSYTEYENPLCGKDAEMVVISYSINWDDTAARNGWDGIFSFYDATSGGRVSFQTAPYLCYNNAAGEYVDIKADAWCTANCTPGTTYLFQYIITADSITVSCDGTDISEFIVTGNSEDWDGSYQCILDALNEYPTLTIGVGLAASSYWNTEISTISLDIAYGEVEGIEASDEIVLTTGRVVNLSDYVTANLISGDTLSYTLTQDDDYVELGKR